MSDLRKAAEIALEVMEYNRANGTPNMGAAIEALRQALAQPKREWVGLDKSDMNVLRSVAEFTSDAEGFIRLVEEKLKGKNT